MPELTCECGKRIEGEDRYRVEAEMWRHAFDDHADMLKSMSVDQLEAWLRDKDQKLAPA